MQMQGLDLKTYLQYTGMDVEKFREGYKASAEKQVKLDLAIEKIIEVEKITVLEEELEAEYKKFADAYNMDIEAVKKAVSEEALTKDLQAKKAMDFIVDNAVVTEEKAAAKKTAAKKDDKAEGEKKPAAKKAAPKKAAEKKPAEKKTAAKKTAKKAETEE